ncbi:hypothetical protein C8R44DRAFT_749557 [Mycena epipterygia]|nr:hypothetical protein C8R44DRAFT_749557 [Mycena epipterygia]
MSVANADLRTRLAEVDALISQTRQRLQELEDIRRPIQCQLDGVVYPVLTLPDEITSEIFFQCLPPSPVFSELEFQTQFGPDALEAPLLLLHVCSEWRSIAIATPSLWVCLHLDLGELPDYLISASDLEEFIADWFGRAGSCPLSFSLHGCPDLEGFGLQTLRAAFLRHAPLLQSVSLQVEYQHVSKLEDIGPFPLLQTLAIVLPYLDDESQEPSLTFPRYFRHAPRLEQVFLGENAIPSMFSFPSEALSKLTCQSLPGDEFLFIMDTAPSLTEFTCSVEPDSLFAYEHEGAVIHEGLQTLRLVDHSSTDFLRNLRLPSLQNLYLSVEDIENTDFLPFLTHSSASLRTFSTKMGTTALSMQWFTIMSGLTHLELYAPGRYFVTAFFSSLDRAQHKEFLPRLESLVFMNSTFYDVRALSSRCDTAPDGSARLQTFRAICFNRSSERPPVGEVETLRGLVGRGMEIYIGPGERNYI